ALVEPRPVPRVGRVAPRTAKVAQSEANEHTRQPTRGALALDRSEDLGSPVRQPAHAERACAHRGVARPPRACAARGAVPILKSAGSAAPASANPFARSSQLSHRPQGAGPGP